MIEVKTKEFESALKKLKRLVNPKSTLPVLGNVCLVSDKGSLSLYSTNLENLFWTSIPCQGDHSEITFGDIANVLKMLPLFEAQTQIDVDERLFKVKLISGKKSIQLSGISAEEFPPIPTPLENPALFFEVDDLIAKYKKIKHSLSTDDARPILQCVCFDKDNLVATDGFVISVVPFMDMPTPESFIIHQSSMDLLDLISEQKTTTLRTDLGKCRFEFFGENAMLAGQLIEGRFPDYRVIVPEGEPKETYHVDRKSLIESLKFLMTIKTDDYNFVIAKGGILSKKSEETEISVEQPELNGQIEFGFNDGFMKNALTAQFTTEFVTIKMYGATHPFMITDDDPQNGLFIQMPCHL